MSDRTTIYDLPEVEPGDYGWCIFRGSTLMPVFYDDDSWSCWREDEPGHECDDDCEGNDLAVVYRGYDLRNEYAEVPFDSLIALPVRFEATTPPANRDDGRIYAIALVPDLDVCRLKIGFTERPIGTRLAAYRTANPKALVVGLWKGSRAAEQAIHSKIKGRIGDSEVFEVDDLEGTLDEIGKILTGAYRL